MTKKTETKKETGSRKAARAPHQARAEERGFERIPAMDVVLGVMRRLIDSGEAANGRQIAADLNAQGYDVDPTWVAKYVHDQRLRQRVTVAAVRDVHSARAETFGEALDIATAVGASNEIKGAALAGAQWLRRLIEGGAMPMPESIRDVAAFALALAQIDRLASQSLIETGEVAAIGRTDRASNAIDVTPSAPKRDRFADLFK